MTHSPDVEEAGLSEAPATFDKARFRHVLGHYPTGVAIVTAMGENGPLGLTVGTFTSVSLDPPMVGFLPDRASTTWPRIERNGRFCVNILARDQEPLCRTFASRAADKFDGVPYHLSALGSPILEGSIAWVDCALESVTPAGDHLIVVGRVHALDVARAHAPLLFLRGQFGHFA